MVLNKFLNFSPFSSALAAQSFWFLWIPRSKVSSLVSLIKFFLQPWISQDFDINFDRLESKKF